MDDKNSSTKEKEKQDTVLTSSESQMSENQTNNSNGNMNNESDSSTTDNSTNDPVFKSAFDWLRQAFSTDNLVPSENKSQDSESEIELELIVTDVSDVSDSEDETSTSSHFSDDQSKGPSPTEEVSSKSSEQPTPSKTSEQVSSKTSEQSASQEKKSTKLGGSQPVLPSLPPPPPPIVPHLQSVVSPPTTPSSEPTSAISSPTSTSISISISTSTSSSRTPRSKNTKQNTNNTQKTSDSATSSTKSSSTSSTSSTKSAQASTSQQTRIKHSQSTVPHLDSANACSLLAESLISPRSKPKGSRLLTKSISVSNPEPSPPKINFELATPQLQNWKPTLYSDKNGPLLFTTPLTNGATGVPNKAQRRLSIRLKAPRPEDLFVENILEDDPTIVEEDGLKFQIDKNDTNKRILLGGTLEALVRVLTSRQKDAKFIQEFLLTLHYFTTPKKVMELLIDRFEYKVPENLQLQEKKESEQRTLIQLRVIEVIQQWLETNFYDFREGNGEVLTLLRQLLATHLKKCVHEKRLGYCETINRSIRYKLAGLQSDTYDELVYKMKNPVTGVTAGKKKDAFLGTKAIEWFKKVLGFEESDAIDICNKLLNQKLLRLKSEREGQSPSPFRKDEKYVFNLTKEQEQLILLRQMVPKNSHKPSSRSMKDFNPLHFAKQLTYFEFKLFKKISFREINYWILGKKANREQEAPNLYTVVAFVNKISSWVATEIVNCATVKQRVALIKRFILAAQHCLQYKNYNGLLEIIFGLNNLSINRLQQTWKAVPKKYFELFQKLAIIVSPEHNWKNYRSVLQSEIPPFLPYIGLYLSDLTFINDGNSTFLRDGKVNWKKMTKLASVLQKIQSAQSSDYLSSIQPDPDFQNFLCTELYILDEKELYRRSRLLESPEPQGTKK